MSEKLLARAAFGAMTVLSIGVALYSLRYYGVLSHLWLGVDPKIQGVIERAPMLALSHMLVAPMALLVGPFQFMQSFRARHLQIHRWLGRIYVAACVIAGAGGLATAFQASGGPIAGFGFGLLAILWVGTTLWAWRAAVARDLSMHRLLMRFSYAMTFGAVTLRLQIPIGFALGFSEYSAMSVWLAYTSWLPNVLIVGAYSIIDVAKGSRRFSKRPDAEIKVI